MERWCIMAETELVFKRTCNYWIDAGIVGFYDTLNKPLPNSETIGEWSKTIKSNSDIDVILAPDQLILKGEKRQIDIALSYALDQIRMTLYDVSTEKQINNMEGVYYNEKEGIVHFPMVKPLTTAQLVLESPRYTEKDESTNLPKDIFEQLKNAKGGIRGKKSKYQKRKNSCFPFFFDQETTYFDRDNNNQKLTNKTCVGCGNFIVNHNKNQAKEWFSGESKNFMPFVEGREANRTFHSYHQVSNKCWECGFVALFSPLLLFFRRLGNDTYYALPYVPGNLSATYQLYRSISGKRGLARALGADLSDKNYESSFSAMPRGIPAFTLSFYYDLFDRLLPKTTAKLLQTSQNIGLIDKRGSLFQTALFLKRDSGQKSFIIRETAVDRSAYFIKLFTYLKKHLDDEGNGKLLDGLRLLVKRASGNGNHLQRGSVIRASQAITEGRHIYRFLLPILSSDLKEDTAHPYDAYQITSLFQKYDHWLFKKEDEVMSSIVEQAKNSGWFLSQDFWKMPGWDDEEKKNLIKRYYYSIERSPSPVKFLEQVRHAYKKAEKEIPKEMIFHKGDGSEDINKFEVYRVYFLAGMLNGLIKKGQTTFVTESPQTVEKED
ncbi:hypothetical protein MNV_2010010 [Candidatus Methanoperedens nitroreducens]|uniref:Uncharacterized protein n=2 Tax=Candidatus Methanoperedens nitratireducens TaxID=1392998 RepID=A0A284VNE1_9EURY|nr:hypothetical protein MNV_2010010 [Candidatus Methanoperedens nitroreducens]